MPVRHLAGNSSSAEQAVRRVLAQYGFADSSVERVEALPRRLKNENYRVRAGGSDWVVKCHPSAPDVRRLELAHTLEKKLADVGFPVAPIQQSGTGRTLVQEGDAHYSLHAWVSGQQVTIADRDQVIARYPDFVRGIASALGTMHTVAGALDHPESDPPVVEAEELLKGPRHVSRILSRPRPRPPLLSKVHVLQLKPKKSAFDRWIIENLPGVVRSAGRLAGQSLGAPSTKIVIHNDINWENLIFSEDFQIRALLDFDNVILAPSAIEVGAAAVVLAGAQSTRLDEFLSGYEDASQIRMDRDSVALAMKLKCTQSILNSINTYLAGNLGDIALLASWCSHLHDSLCELEGR